MRKRYLTAEIIEDKIYRNDFDFSNYDTYIQSAEIDDLMSYVLSNAIRDNDKEMIKNLVSTGLIKSKHMKDIDIHCKDLSGTGIGRFINPQLVLHKDLTYINLSGEDLRNWKPEMLNGVDITGSNFTNTGIGKIINPQILWNKSLGNVILENEDLSHLKEDSLKGVLIEGANLKNTKALIKLSHYKDDNFGGTNLCGCRIVGCPGMLWRYSEDTFDEEYKKIYPQYFLSKEAPEKLKRFYYNRLGYIDEIDYFNYNEYLTDKFLPSNSRYYVFINSLGWELAKDLQINITYNLNLVGEQIAKDIWLSGKRSERFREIFINHMWEIRNEKFDLDILRILNNLFLKNNDNKLPKHININIIKYLHSIFKADCYSEENNITALVEDILYKAIETNRRVDDRFLNDYILSMESGWDKFDDPISAYIDANGRRDCLKWYRYKGIVPKDYIVQNVPDNMIRNFDLKEYHRIINNTIWSKDVNANTFLQMYISLGKEATEKLLTEIPDYISEDTYNKLHENCSDITLEYIDFESDNMGNTKYKIVNYYKDRVQHYINRLIESDFDICGYLCLRYENINNIEKLSKKYAKVLNDERLKDTKEYSSTIRAIEQLEKKRAEYEIRFELDDIDTADILNPQAAHAMFDGVSYEYNGEFSKFFMKNYKQILENFADYRLISKIQREFNALKAEYKTPNFTLEQAKAYFNKVVYKNILPGNTEFAQKAKNCGYSQSDFERLQKVYEMSKDRTRTSIPKVEGSCGEYTYRILDLDDPLNLFVGNLTGCCYDIGKQAQSAMIHGATSKNGRVFVVEKDGELLAQSWIWRKRDVICFDNVETTAKANFVDNNEILEVYKSAAEEIVAKENELVKELLDNGTVSQEQYNKHRLKKVTVGIGYCDIGDVIVKELQEDDERVKPEESKNRYKIDDGDYAKELYVSDSQQGQYILHKSDDYDNFKFDAKEKTLALYSDNRDVQLQEGINISQEMMQHIRHIEKHAYPKEMQILQSIRYSTDISDGFNISTSGMKIAGNRDWYIIYNERYDESIYICDLAKKPIVEDNAFVKQYFENKIRQEIYEYLGRTFKGRIITCESRIDTSHKLIEKLVKQNLVTILSEGKPYGWYRDENIQMIDVVLKAADHSEEEKEVKIDSFMSVIHETGREFAML